MITGNEYIFEDIFQARDYILKIEQENQKVISAIKNHLSFSYF